MKHIIVLLLSLVALPLGADIVTDLAAFDDNGDGLFDQDELERYYLAHDADIAKQRTDGASAEALAKVAFDRAEDARSFRPCGGQACPTISLDTVIEFAQEHLRVSVKATDPKFGWTGLGFERSVTDTPNPRQTKTTQPAIFSYRRDENATDRDSFNIFGGARLYKKAWAIDAAASVPRHFFTFSTGIDFDLDGAKQAHENAIDVGVPLAYEWVAPRDSTGIFTGHVLTLTPKFGTDRAFDREIYSTDLLWSFTSRRLLRAGYLTHFPRAALRPKATIAWTPTVQMEFGDVNDPAGNTDLEARKGTFLRVAPRIDLTFRPIAIHERLSLGVRYFYRIDFREDWQRSYGEATLAYDLTPTGSVAFTAAYRRGRKPPDFKDTDTTVIGIGIKK